VLVEFDNGQTHSYKQTSWFKLHVLQPERPKKLSRGESSLSAVETSQIQEAGLVIGARVEHPNRGHGTVQSFQGATHGHPLYADGTPLKVKIAFDSGETHAYKNNSWDKLRLVRVDAPTAPLETGLSVEQLEVQTMENAGLTVGARVEHPKHGQGIVQSFQGATNGHPLYADGTPLKVKIAFDSGETHAYKTASWHKLRVIQVAPAQQTAAAPASAPAGTSLAAAVKLTSLSSKAKVAAPPSAAAPPPLPVSISKTASFRSATKVVELVRTPLGFGLSVDSQNKVVAIAPGSQAERSGIFAVFDQLLSLNGQPLSGTASYNQKLGAFPVGTKVIFEISKATKVPRVNHSLLAAACPRPPAQLGASASIVRQGSSGQQRVLLEARMSVRIGASPFHAPSVLKLTAASQQAERIEPWTAFSYTTERGTVEVPCRAISAVRMHPGHSHPSFELEYVGPPEEKKKQPGRICTRLRAWATTQNEFDEWRQALAPLPLTEGSAMDRARAWLEHHISELPPSEEEEEHPSNGNGGVHAWPAAAESNIGSSRLVPDSWM
jgi:hypothetical protein